MRRSPHKIRGAAAATGDRRLSSLLYIGIGVAVLVALACGVFFWMSSRTSTVTAVATRRPMAADGLCGRTCPPSKAARGGIRLPTDARGVQCTEEMRYTFAQP